MFHSINNVTACDKVLVALYIYIFLIKCNIIVKRNNIKTVPCSIEFNRKSCDILNRIMNNSTYFHLLFISVSVVYNNNIVAFICNSKNCLFCIMETFWIQKRINYFFSLCVFVITF